jgi:Sulfotransferase domain
VFHLYSNRAASNIKTFCAEAKIIIMLRNPVDMLYSLHAQLMFNGEEHIRDFGAALAADGHRPHDRRLRIKTAHWYKNVANFSEQVQRYFDVFGRDRVLVIIHEDLRRNTPRVYRTTLEFLGVDPEFRPDFRVVNANRELRSLTLHRLLTRLPRTSLSRRLLPPRLHQQMLRSCFWLQQFNIVSKHRPAMDPQLRCSLIREYEPEIQRLSALLRADLGSWLQQEKVLPPRVA